MKKGLLLILPALVLVLAGSVWACHFHTCNPVANCEGWTLAGSIFFGESSSFDMYWEVELYEGATRIDYYSGSEHYSGVDGDITPFSFSGGWAPELCGTYEARLRAWFTWGTLQECSYTTTFPCECPPNGGGGCGTPGFWKNRSDEWPVTSMDIGCTTFNMMDMKKIFKYTTRGDIRVILAQHMIAAYFNLLSGGGSGITGDIDDAMAYLCSYGFDVGPGRRPLGTVPPEGPEKDLGEAIKDTLRGYNETCPRGGGTFDASFDRSFLGDGNEEGKSWGAIKEIYKK